MGQIILIIIVVWILLGGLLDFVALYWPWVIGVIGVIVLFNIYDAIEKRKREAQNKLDREHADQLREVERQSGSFEMERIFNEELFPSLCIIDSNIWMTEEYEVFFAALMAALKRSSKALFLYGPQFDEICNIKKCTAYGEPRNRRARCAISRIEALQNNGLLTIKPIGIESKEGAYADPLIIMLLRTNSRLGNPVTFISNDKELRIRARQILQDEQHGSANYRIYEGDDLIRLCTNYCSHRGILWTQSKISGPV